MITADEVERAVDYLRDSANAAAQARAQRIYLEEFRKVVLAQQMARYPDEPLGVQERNARTSAEYEQVLQALRDAVELDERHRFLRAAAEARIEAWRTLEATRRAEGKAWQANVVNG